MKEGPLERYDWLGRRRSRLPAAGADFREQPPYSISMPQSGRRPQHQKKADMERSPSDVRFAPESCRGCRRPARPLCANSGLMHCNIIGATNNWI